MLHVQSISKAHIKFVGTGDNIKKYLPDAKAKLQISRDCLFNIQLLSRIMRDNVSIFADITVFYCKSSNHSSEYFKILANTYFIVQHLLIHENNVKAVFYRHKKFDLSGSHEGRLKKTTNFTKQCHNANEK